MIHPTQMESVEHLVNSYFAAFARPAAGDSHGGNAAAPSGKAPQDVCLVAVATQYLGPQPVQVACQFAHSRAEAGSIRFQRSRPKAGLADLLKKGPAATA